MAAYVCYYDCSGWTSDVEVINAQGRAAPYRLAVYDRSGGLLIDEERTLQPHQTERLKLNDRVDGNEGKILIQPADDDDDEFPAVLTIADRESDARQANRFVPFFRVHEIEDEDDDDDDDDDEVEDEKEGD